VRVAPSPRRFPVAAPLSRRRAAFPSPRRFPAVAPLSRHRAAFPPRRPNDSDGTDTYA
jgi:hypothetical protein